MEKERSSIKLFATITNKLKKNIQQKYLGMQDQENNTIIVIYFIILCSELNSTKRIK